MTDCDVSVCVPVSRQLQDVAPQGGGLIAATILFLSLAWSGIDPQGAEAVYDIPYQVISSLASSVWTFNLPACVLAMMCKAVTPCHKHHHPQSLLSYTYLGVS